MKTVFTLILFSMCYLAHTQTVIDFTDPSTPTFGTNAQTTVNVNGNTVMMLWAGDANGDQQIIFQGAGSDIAPISNAVFTNPLNVDFEFSFPVNGYDPADLNLDGQIIFQGSGSDLAPISNAVFSNPANVDFEFSFPVSAQIPQN